MIKITHKGDFRKIETFLSKNKKRNYKEKLRAYARMGVAALALNTPMDTGKTASSWDYEIIDTGKSIKIYWTNSNRNDGANVAVLVQYGHATKNGGYVKGIDYINPAMGPIFDSIADAIWKEVSG